MIVGSSIFPVAKIAIGKACSIGNQDIPGLGQCVDDGEIHQQAMQALKRQQDLEAIFQGVADMESGRTQLEEARPELAVKLGSTDKQA